MRGWYILLLNSMRSNAIQSSFSPGTAPHPHPQSCQEAPQAFFFLNKCILDLLNSSSFTNTKVTSHVSLELILTI